MKETRRTIDEADLARDLRTMPTLTCIARKHGTTRETIKARARKLGIPESEWAWKNRTIPALARITDLGLAILVKNQSLSRIAASSGISGPAVHHHLKQRGIPNPRGKHLAPPGARRVASNGNISWKGRTAAVGRDLAGLHVHVEEIEENHLLTVYRDGARQEFVKTTRLPATVSHLVFSIVTDMTTRERLLSLDQETIKDVLKRRIDGETVGRLATTINIDRPALEHLFRANGIKPRRTSITHVKECVETSHPGAVIHTTTISRVQDRVSFTCENGHLSEKTAATILSGSWCGECFAKQAFQGETACRNAAERVFGVSFPRARPSWLKQGNGRRLELDMFNTSLKIAIEYNGKQHYMQHDFYHHDEADFQRQQFLDATKINACKRHGVTLIIVPHFIPREQLDQFLEHEASARGIHSQPNKARHERDGEKEKQEKQGEPRV